MPADRGVARGTDRGIADRPGVHVPGVYESVLRQWCKREIVESGGYMSEWLLASDDPVKLAEWEAGIAALADLLFDERVVLREPVIAWWYWLPLPLPAPLDRVGRGGDGPRRVRVTPDDVISLMAPDESLRWSRTGGAGTPTGPEHLRPPPPH
jgi:hypothetical protein